MSFLKENFNFILLLYKISEFNLQIYEGGGVFEDIFLIRNLGHEEFLNMR